MVRQRRNRVWGAAVCDFGEGEFAKAFKGTLLALQSHCRFPMEKVFLEEQRVELRSDREMTLLERAVAEKKAAAWLNLYCIYTYREREREMFRYSYGM